MKPSDAQSLLQGARSLQVQIDEVDTKPSYWIWSPPELSTPSAVLSVGKLASERSSY
jgi:hypothetical protein